MTLFHGTNADIETIDLSIGLRFKDFGKGFLIIGKESIRPNRWHRCCKTGS